MRYLLNLPLVILALALARLFAVAVLIELRGGNDNTIGTGYEIVFETGVIWLNVAIVLAACGAMGGIRWPGARGFAGFMVGLLAFGGIILLSLQPIGIAIEPNAVIHSGMDQAIPARLVAFGLPLVVLIYGAWIVNAPPASRGTPAVHLGALGVTGLLCLTAVVVSLREFARENEQARTSRETSAEVMHVESEPDRMRRTYAALTDADPLTTWASYIGQNAPKDIRADALSHMVKRPELDAELIQLISGDDHIWEAGAFSLITELPFTPSPALVEAVRDAIAKLVDRATRASTEPGTDRDKQFDYNSGYMIAITLPVAERIARTTGTDLTPSIDALTQAVALYPQSETARSFPPAAAETKARMARMVAERTK